MNKTFRGDSTAIAKIVRITPSTPISGQVFSVWNKAQTKRESYTALVGDTAGSVVSALATALQASSVPEFADFLAAVSDDGTALILTAATAGVPFDVVVTTSGNVIVSESTAGGGAVNEVHKISLIGNYTGGTFTVTYNFGAGNVTSGNIAYNATASAMQTALAAMTGVGSGNVLVTGGAGPSNPWFVTFTGSLGGQAIAAGTVNGANLSGGATVNVSEVTAGNGLSDEIQMLDCSVLIYQGAFNFTLSLDGQTTSTVNTNMSAAQIQTALQALPNVGTNNALVYASPLSAGEPIAYWIHFTGALAATNVSQLVVNWGYGSAYHSPVVTTLQDGGQTTSDDFQFLDLGIAGTGLGIAGTVATFTVTYQGQTTGSISNNACPALGGGNPAALLQAALQGLSAIGAGNCLVYGSSGLVGSTSAVMDGFLIRLTGAKANTRGTNFTATVSAGSGAVITRLSTGQANTNEVQQVYVAATGGTFTLTLGAQTTSAIAWNASTGTLQTRIQTDLSSAITSCTVTGSGTFAAPWLVTVTNPADTPIAVMMGNGGSLTGGTGTIIELTAGHAGTNEVQVITLAAGTSGGTFNLAFNGSVPTDAMPWNATASQLQAELRSLPTINTVGVTGSAGGPWTVTWSGAQAGTVQPRIVADGSLLTGMTSVLITLATTTWSTGENHYDDDDNWAPIGVPGALDTVHFCQGATDCLYGLEQIATFTVNTGTNKGTFTSYSHLHAGQAVYCTSTTTLPSPLAGNTIYYLVNVNRDAQTFQLATAAGGTPVTLTTTGAGTHTISARPSSIEFSSNYTGSVGLPFENPGASAGSYIEYRQRYLHIGLATLANGGLQQVTIGTGDGSGSRKIQLDTDIDAVSLKLIQTGGSSESGVNAVLWKGTNPANGVEIISGDFGSCLFPGETANLASFKERSGSVTLGAGVTVAGPLDKTGGSIIIDGATINGVVYSR